MKIFSVLIISILSVFALVIMFFGVKSHRLLRTLIFNAFLGLCTMAIIDLTAKFTGAYIPVNFITVGLSSVFGVPAAILLILLKIVLI